MAGTPYWRLTTAVMSSSARMPSLTRLVPSRPPFCALMVQRFLELDGSDALFAQQKFAESDGHELSRHGRTWGADFAGRTRRRTLRAEASEATLRSRRATPRRTRDLRRDGPCA